MLSGNSQFWRKFACIVRYFNFTQFEYYDETRNDGKMLEEIDKVKPQAFNSQQQKKTRINVKLSKREKS